MSKNRDYTGLIRTPSSMAWLINHRARVKGQVDRLMSLQDTLPEKIKTAKAELAAIDAVIPLHQVKVDPSAIKGSRPKGPALAAHGVMTRFLLKRLRESAGQPLYTTEMALHFARENGIDLSKISEATLMDRVSRRLRLLATKGFVRRHHSSETRETGRWSLIDDGDD